MAGRVRYSEEYKEERLALAREDKRRCSRCNAVKVLSAEFDKDEKGVTGRMSYCKECRRSATRAWRAGGGRIKRALENGYYRALKKGLPAEWIELDELIAYWEQNGIDPGRCFYTGVLLGSERGADNEFNLEHKYSLASEGTPGHVLENLVPACWGFNTYKKDKHPVSAYLYAPENLRPVLEYEGATDELGNPLAPPVVDRGQPEPRELKRRGE